MKRLLILPLLAALVVFSCKKDPIIDNQDLEPITFNFPDTLEFAVSSLVGLNIPWVIPSVAVTTGFQENVGGLDPLVSAVEDITLQSLDLEVISPPGLEFDWLKHITLFVNAPGEPQVELAHLFDIPDGSGTRISLEPAPNLLDEYVKSEDFTLDAQITVDELLLQDIQLRVYMDFEVTLINN